MKKQAPTKVYPIRLDTILINEAELKVNKTELRKNITKKVNNYLKKLK